MALYYTLKNGEDIEIDVQEDEIMLRKKITIKLFGGSTTLTYDWHHTHNLNEIIAEIEKEYDTLKQKDYEFEYKCWCD